MQKLGVVVVLQAQAVHASLCEACAVMHCQSHQVQCLPMMVSLQRLRPSAAMTFATLCFLSSALMVLGNRSMAAKYSVSHTVKLSYNKSSCKHVLAKFSMAKGCCGQTGDKTSSRAAAAVEVDILTSTHQVLRHMMVTLRYECMMKGGNRQQI